jgi:hypothetical protein
MTNITHDVAGFVLPVTASFAAIAAAFVAFTARRQAIAVAAVARPQTTDLMGSGVWFDGSVTPATKQAASYDPQSRGSSG